MPKARKDHVCTLCFEVIPKGEKYHRQSITPWDHPDNDGFYELKAHLRCMEIWEKEGDRYDWTFPVSRADWNDIAEEYQEVNHE